MATIGLKNLYRALVTETGDVVSYGTPKKMKAAISADLSVEFAEGTLYGDDSIDTSVKEFASGELSLNVTDLTPDEYKELLGQTQDSDGVNYAGSADSAPYWAIGFQARRPDGKYRFVWLYKVIFAVPEENYATKEDGIDFQTPTITGTIMTRADGIWKADYVGLTTDSVAQSWFNSVRVTGTTVSIAPGIATYDKTNAADVVFTLSATPTAVKNGATALTVTTDYTISGNSVTIKSAYLADASEGDVAINVVTASGTASARVVVSKS